MAALAIALGTVLVPAPAGAGERSLAPPDCQRHGGTAVTVTAAITGDSLRLADGSIVRLAGIDAVRAPLGAAVAASEETLAATARERAFLLAAGEGVQLVGDALQPDRYGRVRGEIILADGRSLQAALLAEGLARVHPFVDETICLGPLFAAERSARKMQVGLWAGHLHAAWRADDASLATRNGLYELVEGRVVSVGVGSRLAFIDFGRDWGRSFTVMLPVALAADMAKSGVPLTSLARHRVRVRGVVEMRAGPAIRVETAAAIELLDDD
jgi:endonuclease YncB( thermonuclease family)